MSIDKRQLAEIVFFYIRTIYNDLLGYNVRRNALLRSFWATQKTITRLGQEITCIVVENRESAATALMLHGSPGNAMDWDRFLHNPDIFSIWAVDRPGYGPTPQKKPTLEDDIEIMGDLIGKIPDERKLILVGHSLGTGIAMRLAADYPDKVGGLILVGTALLPYEDQFIDKVFSLVEFTSGLFSRSIRHSAEESRQYDRFLHDLYPEMENIKCPVTLIHGRDDLLAGVNNVQFTKEKLKNSALVKTMMIDGEGHFIPRTRPGAISKAMREMVKVL